MALIKSTAIPSGATDYEIEQSLRFNDDDGSRLVRTPTSNGNRRTFTLSVWVKRGNHTLGTDQEQDIIGAFYASNASRYSYIAFDDSDRIIIFGGEYSTSATVQSFYRRTKAKYRDSSAWYHIVWRHDSTDGTATNRDRLYVNGVLQDWDTSLGTDLVCGQNEDSFFNYTTSPMTIGEYASTNATSTMEFDGYMAEMHWIDGTSVATTSFGETGDYGEWKPIEYKGSYGTNGFYLSFAGGGIMSATGGTITTDGDYKVHSFTANGTFTPSSITGDGYVEYLVIGGGGAGAADGSTTAGNGGGGAGGYRTGMLPVTAQAYSITVGAGGVGTTGSNQVNGGNSVFSSITSTGGGGGGYFTSTPGAAGGSGGGGAAPTAVGGAASPAGQGNAGEQATNGQGGGGGGGAGEAGGTDGTGQGGDGLASSITGSSVTRAGGGGGSRASGGARAGGTGGGGAGGNGGAGTSGTANTGSGGGAGVSGGSAGSGGSGIVIIRYKFQ